MTHFDSVDNTIEPATTIGVAPVSFRHGVQPPGLVVR